MCFDRDASPPILAGDHQIARSEPLTLVSADGTRFAAFEAVSEAAAATVLVLPDVRGLHPYYEELACRFAQHGYRALAMDYFGRTAEPPPDRPWDFAYAEHVDQLQYAQLRDDVSAAVGHLRATGSVGPIHTIGFCFGGRLSFLSATFGLSLAGVIALHAGLGPRGDIPPPAALTGEFRSPVLGLFGGADPSIPPQAIAEFDAALTAARVEHRFVSYPGAPHSFFDRTFTEFAKQSAAAWTEVLEFVGGQAVVSSSR
jgi:carboxymethylenebutenolidase